MSRPDSKYFWDEQHCIRVRGDPAPVRVSDEEICRRLEEYETITADFGSRMRNALLVNEARLDEIQELKERTSMLSMLLKEARKIVQASSSGRAGVHTDWMERTKDLA